MEKLFGIPIDSMLAALTITLAILALGLAVAALRNLVVFKLGVRSIARRPAQTILIILGLMLATLLFSAALVTGDTMDYSIRKTAIEGLGETDIIIQPKKEEGASLAGAMGQTFDGYLKPKDLTKVENALSGGKLIDGLTPALRERVPASAPKTRLNLPSLSIMGVKSDYTKEFGSLKTKKSKQLTTASLGADQVYVNKKAADKLEIKSGGKIRIFVGAGPRDLKVKDIFTKGGKPSLGPVMIMPLADAQKLFNTGAGFNNILISGKGDELAGAKQTKAMLKEVKPIFKDRPFKVEPVKKDALDEAEEAASMFTSIFLVFGQFSMMAGIMLIFLIFVMLAAERKIELGVMRALGLQRRDLIKVFVFEGTLYALLSAVVGALLGIAIGWGMVRVMAVAFGQIDNFSISFHFTPKSIILAYAMGVIATFAIVVFSAWRAGRVNIVRAIRDLPEPVKAGLSLKWLIFLIAMLGLAGLVMMSGFNGQQKGTFVLGLSLIVIIVPLLARWARLPDRAAFSIAGLGLLVLWLMPEDVFVSIIPDYDTFKGGIELFFISGMAIVTGAVWVVMYNSDIMLSVITRTLGRIKGMPPMLRIAVNYPMKNRIRTGLALAMVSLVIFTIVFMSALLNSFNSLYDDTESLSGGYDIQGITGYANPIKDINKTLNKEGGRIDSKDIKETGSFAMAPAELRQKGKKKKWVDFAIQGVDSGYAKSVNYKLTSMSAKYGSSREVWKAVADDPNLVIVHSILVPAKVNFNVGGPPFDFQLSGFYKEDKKIPRDIYIEARNPATGKISELKVVGVAEDMAIYIMGGVITSQKTLNKVIGAPVPATTFYFKLKPDVDVPKTSKALAKTFYKNGMETKLTADEIGQNIQASKMINRLLQGFMGLGLIVGIAALGVIAARSVVERRRQIGLLRAIGFHRGMVQNTFILESTFVAFLGITIGSVLGLILSRNVATFMAKDMPGITFTLPWVEVLLIGGLAYIASLLTTYLPARQAAKVYPAEALRYE